MTNKGWIGVDFDGTLAHYTHWKGPEYTDIGAPIPAMVDRVVKWLAEGREVRIFTARVYGAGRDLNVPHLERWCLEHLGRVLPITCTKDYEMIELWDDRAVQVVPNTGRRADQEWQLGPLAA